MIFSTVQIEVGRWRWLPVNCVDAVGAGVTSVVIGNTSVNYLRYGELSPTIYTPNTQITTLVGTYLSGVTSIFLTDSSGFPPENGKIQLDAGGANDEVIEYSFNNVSNGEITLSTATVRPHVPLEDVLRIDWVEVDGVNIPGSYLLSFTPAHISKTDLFTYVVARTAGSAFESFQNTIDVIDTGDPGTLLAPSLATCKLYGHVVDLQGFAVKNSSISARLLTTPASVSNAGISDNSVSATTDSNGYFELLMAQGTTVDIVIPGIGYRRTLVVPNTTLAKLFEIA